MKETTEKKETCLPAWIDEEETPVDVENLAVENGTTDPVRLYLKQVAQIPCLSQEEESILAQNVAAGLAAKAQMEEMEAEGMIPDEATLKELGKAVKAGEQAQNKLVESHLRLVVSIVRSFCGYGLDYLDLIQEGNLGLIKAIEKFDGAKGYRLSTYAVWWIRQHVRRKIYENRMVRLPVHIINLLTKLNRKREDLQQKLQRNPTISELSAAMDLPEEKVKALIRVGHNTASLDTPVGEEDEGATLVNFVACEEKLQTAEVAHSRLLKEEVHNLLDTLDEREQLIIRLRFGFMDGVCHTLDDIGAYLGLTRERVRQLEKRALEKLRHPSRSKYLEEYAC